MKTATSLAIEYWSNEVARKVREMTMRDRFEHAIGAESLTCSQIAERLKMSPELTRYHLKRLGIDAVDTVKSGRTKPARVYSIKPRRSAEDRPTN